MSLYHIVFLLLFVGVLIEYVRQDTPKWLYFTSILVLSLMLLLRFGQGSDFYSYNSIYTTMPLDMEKIKNYQFFKVEIGWRLFCAGFKMLGFNFSQFLFVISSIELLLLGRFISRYSKNHMLTLFLSYHTLYLTYFFSALRQAFVIAVFLGVLLQWLFDGKWIRYCIGVIACSLIHTVSLVLLLPLLFQVVRFSFKQMVALVAIGFSLGLVLSILNVGSLLAQFISSSYLEDTSISLFATLERLVSYVIVTYVYYVYVEGMEPEQNDGLFRIYKIYSLGILLYGLLLWSPLISSRAIYMFKIMEIPLLSVCITKCKRGRSLILAYCLLLCSALYYKNIGNYIDQGKYKDTSVMNYPYVSIFDSERIAHYRKDTGYYIDWLEFDFDSEYVAELKRIYEEEVPKDEESNIEGELG